MVIRRTGASALLLLAGPARLIKSNRLFAGEDRMRTNAKLLRPHDCKKLSISVVGVKKVAKIVHCGEQLSLK